MSTIDTGGAQIGHVSDTALWVAVYRAMETERKDALFNDPYAERLAGDRGRRIVETMRNGKEGAWSMIVRTVVLDEFIYKVLREDGIDTVVNLAAGLDTRPYRLELPSSLRWIEVDFPDMIANKEEKLADAKPHCELERVKLDLTDVDARRALFSRINSTSKRVAIIAEGLLVYLKEEEVAELASDLHSKASFRWWMVDIVTPELLAFLKRGSFRQFTEGRVIMQFAPAAGAEFFRSRGWTVSELRSVARESRRLNRQMPRARLYRIIGLLASKKQKEYFSKLDSHFVLLKRTSM